jgi:hypothetical protein
VKQLQILLGYQQFPLDLTSKKESLSLGIRQFVENVKLLFLNPRTKSLPKFLQEVKNAFTLLLHSLVKKLLILQDKSQNQSFLMFINPKVSLLLKQSPIQILVKFLPVAEALRVSKKLT